MAQKFTVPITVKQLSSAGSDAITVYVDADTYSRLKIEAGGRLTWGPGNGAGDVNLYRDAADVLRTDDTFKTPTLYVDNIEIDPTGATTDQVLKFNGTKFISASAPAGATNLDGLTDVTIVSPEKYQTLVYDGTDWINEFPTTVSLVNNAEATTLTVGTAVYLYGNVGNHASVKRADNDSDATSSKTVGLVAAAIPAGGNGPVVTRGYVTGMDLSSGYTAGQVLWLGENGGLTTTKPTAPEHLVFIGVVVRATSNGIIYVATQNGYELDELHDVSISSPNIGDVLTYNGSLWTSASVAVGGASVTASTTPPAGPDEGDLWLDSANVDLYVRYSDTWVQLTGEDPVVEDLNDLADVTVPSPNTGDVLTYDGTYWTSASVSTVITSSSAPAGAGPGSIWFDSDDGKTFINYDSTWVEIGAQSTTARANVSSTPPVSPAEGDMWFDSDDARTYTYYDGSWVELGASGFTALVSDSAPTSPVAGQIWYKSDTGGTYIYYGTTWIEIGASPPAGVSTGKAIAMSIVFGG